MLRIKHSYFLGDPNVSQSSYKLGFRDSFSCILCGTYSMVLTQLCVLWFWKLNCVMGDQKLPDMFCLS